MRFDVAQINFAVEGDPIIPPSEEELAQEPGLAQAWAEAQEALAEELQSGCDLIVCKHRIRGNIVVLCAPSGLLGGDEISLPLIQFFTTGKFRGNTYQYDVELNSEGTVVKKRGGDKDLTEEQITWLRELFLSQRRETVSEGSIP